MVVQISSTLQPLRVLLRFAVNALFTLAEKLKPSIIFVDEAESFLGRREERDHEASSTMKTEFLQMWDGFGTNRKGATFWCWPATLLPCGEHLL